MTDLRKLNGQTGPRDQRNAPQSPGGARVFFDLETSGMDPEVHDVIQIAAVAVTADELEELAAFEVKVRFDLDAADPEALRVNSYERAAWEDAIQPEAAVDRFDRFLRDHATVRLISRAKRPYFVARLAGHNAERFDGPFWRTWAGRHHRPLGPGRGTYFFPAELRILDTCQAALWYFEGARDDQLPASFRLEDLAERFGIHLKAHDALEDVRAAIALARIFRGIDHDATGGP